MHNIIFEDLKEDIISLVLKTRGNNLKSLADEL